MENNQIKYIIYKTTNKLNNKIYIGIHKTKDPEIFDGYIGLGVYVNKKLNPADCKYPFQRAVLKYGPENFERQTLKVFDNEEDAKDLERWLVDEEFIKREDTYNVALGGGVPPNTSKVVYQFDTKGILLKTWNSETEVKEHYGMKVDMSRVVLGKRSFAGYFWAFDKTIDVSFYKIELNHGFINQYTLEGELVETFKTTTEASAKLGIKRETITQAVFRKRPTKGYYFLKAGIDIYDFLNYQRNFIGKRKVYRYSSDGMLNKEYSTISEVIRDNIPCSVYSIKKAIRNKTLYKNYLWSFKKSLYYKDINSCEEPVVKIAQYDLNMNLIKIWDNIKSCKKAYKYCLEVCRGKLRQTQHYIFKYID